MTQRCHISWYKHQYLVKRSMNFNRFKILNLNLNFYKKKFDVTFFTIQPQWEAQCILRHYLWINPCTYLIAFIWSLLWVVIPGVFKCTSSTNYNCFKTSCKYKMTHLKFVKNTSIHSIFNVQENVNCGTLSPPLLLPHFKPKGG